jgi:dipeptidyl-peptidase 4
MKLRADQRSLGACAFLAASLLICASAPAQQGGSDAKRTVTAADYAQAEKFMPYNTTPLVYGADRATWLSVESLLV